MLSNINFRSVLPDDIHSIKQLHEEFFPVRYNDEFFRDACMGLGVNNTPLYTCLAVKKTANFTEKIIGFIFAQFISYDSSEDKDIIKLKLVDADNAHLQTKNKNNKTLNKFSSHSSESKQLEMLYILTLGVRKEYRRSGLASQLLSNSIEFAHKNTRCGCLYLHVIESNPVAIRFYEKHKFIRFKLISGMSPMKSLYCI